MFALNRLSISGEEWKSWRAKNRARDPHSFWVPAFFFLVSVNRGTCLVMLNNETELMVSLYSSGVSSLARCSSIHFGKRVLPYQTAQSMVPAKIARTGNKCHFLRSRSYRLHNVIFKCREHRNWSGTSETEFKPKISESVPPLEHPCY